MERRSRCACRRKLYLKSFGAVPESAVPESAETMLAETVLAETVLAETVALRSHGSAEKKALGSASWTAAPAPRRRNVSARGGVGSRAVPPLRARQHSQERATGLLLDYRRVLAGGTGSPTACLARGRAEALPEASGSGGPRKACAGGGGANHVCTHNRVPTSPSAHQSIARHMTACVQKSRDDLEAGRRRGRAGCLRMEGVRAEGASAAARESACARARTARMQPAAGTWDVPYGSAEIAQVSKCV
jgi:hypothetical protein